MTMPDERTRSLVQTREFLRELTQPSLTPGLVDAMRTKARRLLRHYPLLMELDLLARRCPAVLAPPQRPGADADLPEQSPPKNRHPLALEDIALSDHGVQDYRRLLMNLAAVRLLQQDPGLVERAMTTLARWRETADPPGHSLLDDWRGILETRDWSLALERSERGKHLRQRSPLFTLLSNETRDAITQQVKALRDDSKVEFEPARVGALCRPAQFDTEPAADAVLALRQVQAGQVVFDSKLDKALSARNAAIRVVRSCDERLDRMLLSVRRATLANTMDRMNLVAYLEEFMVRHDIHVLGDTTDDDVTK